VSDTLVAVTTCHRLRHRADAQRETWVPRLQEQADIKFFIGWPSQTQRSDEIPLQTWDVYERLPHKGQKVCQYALEHGYERLFKTDDDTYIYRLEVPTQSYVGRIRGASGKFPASYCSGFAYWLDRQAMEVIANAGEPNDFAEDRWVGNTLAQAGITPVEESRYLIIGGNINVVPHTRLLAVAELEPDKMKEVHARYLEQVQRKVERCSVAV
jgi:hypothetical protein